MTSMKRWPIKGIATAATSSGRIGRSLRIRLTAGTNQKLASAVVKLPSGISIRRGKLAGGVRWRGTPAAYTLTRHGANGVLITPRKATKALTFTIPASTLSISKSAASQPSLVLPVTIAMTDNSVQRPKLTLRRH